MTQQWQPCLRCSMLNVCLGFASPKWHFRKYIENWHQFALYHKEFQCKLHVYKYIYFIEIASQLFSALISVYLCLGAFLEDCVVVYTQGVASGIFLRRADSFNGGSFNEGLKYRQQRTMAAGNIREKTYTPFDGGLACSPGDCSPLEPPCPLSLVHQFVESP